MYYLFITYDGNNNSNKTIECLLFDRATCIEGNKKNSSSYYTWCIFLLNKVYRFECIACTLNQQNSNGNRMHWHFNWIIVWQVFEQKSMKVWRIGKKETSNKFDDRLIGFVHIHFMLMLAKIDSSDSISINNFTHDFW